MVSSKACKGYTAHVLKNYLQYLCILKFTELQKTRKDHSSNILGKEMIIMQEKK